MSYPDCLVWQMLRMTALMSTTGLFMPLEKNMLQVYVCVDTWMTTGIKCFQGLHLAAVIASTIIALALAAFALIGAYLPCCESTRGLTWSIPGGSWHGTRTLLCAQAPRRTVCTTRASLSRPHVFVACLLVVGGA